MVVEKLFGIFPTVAQERSKISDFVDRLNYLHTVMLLFGSIIVVSIKQYVFEPIQCWMPPEFPKSWEQYAENYCWVQNTYFLPIDTAIPDVHDQKEQLELSYYQWVPFILALQAVLFYAPFGFWIVFNTLSGVNVDILVTMASKCLSEITIRDEAQKSMAHYWSQNLGLMNLKRSKDASFIRKRFTPIYLSSVYLISKVLHVINSVSQLFLLNRLLGTRDSVFGVRLLSNIIHGVDWEHSAIFPRVTLCDFTIRDIGQNRPHTVQCVLPTNMLNEKIFIFFWFWLVFLSIINVLCLFWWMCKLGVPSQRLNFVASLLSHECSHFSQTEPHHIRSFVFSYLFPDGIFLIRLLHTNFGAVLSADLVNLLWTEYLNTEKGLSESPPAVITGNVQKILVDPPEPEEKGGFFEELTDSAGELRETPSAAPSQKSSRNPVEKNHSKESPEKPIRMDVPFYKYIP